MFEITAYSAVRMRAKAMHGATSHWVEIEVTEQIRKRPPQFSQITVHFDCDNAERKANAYAAAINMVDDHFHSIKTVLDRSIARSSHEEA